MVKRLTVEAKAKINLGLEVIRKRDDGYHEIVTVFQEIALADRLEMTLTSKGITLDVNNSQLPSGKENLAYQAAELFYKGKNLSNGVTIKLTKNIPAAAGLGGGSSDAAAVLKGLNELNNKAYSLEELTRMAAEIGSDVPFFIRGGTAYATGRGEILEYLPVEGFSAGVVIVKPEINFRTADMYSRLKLGLTNRTENIKILRHVLLEKRFGEIEHHLFNRFEETALTICREIGFIKQHLLEAGCRVALMCGSGSAVFGLTHNALEAKSVKDKWAGGEQIIATEISAAKAYD